MKNNAYFSNKMISRYTTLNSYICLPIDLKQREFNQLFKGFKVCALKLFTILTNHKHLVAFVDK